MANRGEESCVDPTINSDKALKCARCFGHVNLDKNKNVVIRCENCADIDRKFIIFLTEEFKKLELKNEARFANIMQEMERYESQVCYFGASTSAGSHNLADKSSSDQSGPKFKQLAVPIHHNFYPHVNATEIPRFSRSATNERYDYFISFQDPETLGVVKASYFLKNERLSGEIRFFAIFFL